jgi:hypothetical protein
LVGRERIAEFLASLEGSDLEIVLSDEVLGRGIALAWFVGG